jgi:transposase
MMRMLLVGYVFAIRSERRLCSEVQVNLAYRWFCKLGIEDRIPDHSVFCRARNERFRESDALRRVLRGRASRLGWLAVKHSRSMPARSRWM